MLRIEAKYFNLRQVMRLYLRPILRNFINEGKHRVRKKVLEVQEILDKEKGIVGEKGNTGEQIKQIRMY